MHLHINFFLIVQALTSKLKFFFPTQSFCLKPLFENEYNWSFLSKQYILILRIDYIFTSFTNLLVSALQFSFSARENISCFGIYLIFFHILDECDSL